MLKVCRKIVNNEWRLQRNTRRRALRKEYSTLSNEDVYINEELDKCEKLENEALEKLRVFKWEEGSKDLKESMNIRMKLLTEELKQNHIPVHTNLSYQYPLLQNWVGLAQIELTQGKLNEAVKVFGHSIGILDDVLEKVGKTDTTGKEEEIKKVQLFKASILTDFATTQQAMGNIMAAQKDFTNGIRIMENLGMSDAPIANILRSHLALLYESIGNYESATPLNVLSMKYLPFIEVWNHPHFATTLHLMNHQHSRVFTTMKKDKETLDMIENTKEKQVAQANSELTPTIEILKINDITLGKNHPKTVSIKIFLATLYKRLGLYEEAIKTLEDASKCITDLYGEQHAFTATIHCHLGMVYEAKADYTAAETHLKEALKIRTKVFGPDHLHTALAEYDLSNIFWEQAKVDETSYLLDNARKSFARNLGQDHVHTQFVTHILLFIGKGLHEYVSTLDFSSLNKQFE